MKKHLIYCALFLSLFTQFLYGETLPEKVHKKLLIIHDFFNHEINGVASVINQVKTRLEARNYDVHFLTLSNVSLIKFPFSGELNVANPYSIKSEIATAITQIKPDYIFIALTGVMSDKATSYCTKLQIPYTIFYPGRGPECLKTMVGLPIWLTRYFINHSLLNATNVLVPSYSMRDELVAEGFTNIVAWPHGIDTSRFTLPTTAQKNQALAACGLQNLPRPLYLYVGRVSAEKNIPDFLNVKLPGTKIVVGPEHFKLKIDDLRTQYPNVIFTGAKIGEDLLNYYRSADVFLFPSKMDSFGLVMLEALAMGLPVVGFNTNGPRDVVPVGCGVSYLTDDLDTLNGLATCAQQAWSDVQSGTITAKKCHSYTMQFSWDCAINVLEKTFVQIPETAIQRALKYV